MSRGKEGEHFPKTTFRIKGGHTVHRLKNMVIPPKPQEGFVDTDRLTEELRIIMRGQYHPKRRPF